MKRIVLGICLVSGCQDAVRPHINQHKEKISERYPLLNIEGCHVWDKKFIYARPDIIRTRRDFECLRHEKKRAKKKRD